MDKLKILVVAHKEAELYADGVYIPIQVGKALTDKNLGYLCDNTGDNISEKNPMYCELTAQYWAWRNLKAEYVGLCHYRRYFNKVFTPENIDAEMAGCDFIVAETTVWHSSIIGNWAHCLVPEDVMVFREYMLRRFPEQKDVFDSFFLKNNRFYPCNMFIARKEQFDRFAEWQFSILSDLEQVIKPSGYARPRRILGYIAEALLSYYILINGLKVREFPMVSMPGATGEPLRQSGLQKLSCDVNFRLRASKGGFDMSDAMKVGLRNDGIIDRIEEIVRKYRPSER